MNRRHPWNVAFMPWGAIVAVAAISTIASGNVYPTNLGQSSNTLNTTAAQTVTLSYLLNEDATNVLVSILDSSNSVVRTINPGAQPKGSNSVLWDGTDDGSSILPDGNYSFRVASTGESRTQFTLLNDDNELNNFFTPRGVSVNKNPDSPFYGRVYVSEGAGGSTTAAGRLVGDGIYMLNADLTDTGIPGGTGPHTGGIPWLGTSNTSPYKVEVGPDDSVYLTDWSDAHSGLWQANPDLSGTWIEVLDNTDRQPSGLNDTHGSISDVVVVGTGANRTIYTSDEDFVPPDGSTGSILRYDIGETTTFTGPPSGFAYIDGTGADTEVNRIQNFQDSIARDSDGNFWMSQFRSTVPSPADTLPSLIQVDSSGNVLWASVPDGAPSTANDPLRGIQGIAYDPVNGLLALATSQSGGVVLLFDPETKTIVTQFDFGATTNTDVGFDNAGNIYVVNRTTERLRVWAPPNGPIGWVANEFSTSSLGPLGSILLTSGASVPGDHNGDGVVDARDYVLWRKDPAAFGGAQGYTDWRSNFGAGNGNGGGLNTAVPEPASAALILLGLMCSAVRCRRR